MYGNEDTWHLLHALSPTDDTKSWAMVTGRIQGLALATYYRELCLDKLILYVHTYHVHPSDSMVHCADTPDTENLRETSELSNSVIFVAREYFSRSSVHITTTETGRLMWPDRRRSKTPSFVYPPAPDPQPRWAINHIRMAPEMGPGEAGDKPLIHIPDTSAVGIFTHICTGLGISLIPGTIGIPYIIPTPAIRYLAYSNGRFCGTSCKAYNAIVANYWLGDHMEKCAWGPSVGNCQSNLAQSDQRHHPHTHKTT